MQHDVCGSSSTLISSLFSPFTSRTSCRSSSNSMRPAANLCTPLKSVWTLLTSPTSAQETLHRGHGRLRPKPTLAKPTLAKPSSTCVCVLCVCCVAWVLVTRFHGVGFVGVGFKVLVMSGAPGPTFPRPPFPGPPFPGPPFLWTPSTGPPKIPLFFFTLPPQFSFLLPSLGCLLVEFWCCFEDRDPQMCALTSW